MRTLRGKLLLNFLFVSLFPFAILFTYIIFFGQTKIVEQSVKEQNTEANNIAHRIHKHLEELQKELAFLASLDLMDDLLADDIDKRVSILLTKKADDLGSYITLFVINKNNRITASSEPNVLDKTFIKENKLYMYRKIYASFDKTNFLGTLVLKYDLSDLDRYLIHKEGGHLYISDNRNFRIGDKTQLDFVLLKKQADIITEEHVIVYEKLDAFLENYYLIYAVDKSLALKFFYDFIEIMFFIAVFGVLIIVFLALRYSKNIVKPIEKLTAATQNIKKEQDYSHVLKVESNDEIGVLTSSFNDMLQTTSEALVKLEEENRLRLQRFIQLIEVFNIIIQTNNEQECMDIAMREIKSITLKDDLKFLQKSSSHGIDLYVTDFEANKKVYFGSISLSLDGFIDKNEQKFYTSITNMIMLQLDKIRLTQRTMAVSNAKSAFISHMSHELRTPLNSIIGSTQFLIAYENMSDDQQDTIANIESSAHYLLNMINEILDIAKIESGKMDVHKEEVNIAEMIKSSYNMLQPLAEDKGLKFEIIQSLRNDLIVYTDLKIAQQIIINLLSNAIKFTEKGFVNIELFLENNTIILHIKDSGIGIKQEDIGILFHEFTQVENEIQNKYKGTGLGLSLSKKLAELLGIDLSLKSDGIHKGTTACLVFYI